MKYVEFPKNAKAGPINRASNATLQDLMFEFIGSDYHKNTRQAAHNGPLRIRCKQLISKAAAIKEFEVCRQTFDNWAIVWQASQKMKSSKKKTKSENIGTAPISKLTKRSIADVELGTQLVVRLIKNS